MINLRENEHIIYTCKRHLFILLLEILPIAFFAFLIVGGVIAFVMFAPETFFVLLAPILFLSLFFLHLFWIALFVILADFFLDMWILTNKRLFIIEQRGLFSRTISEFGLARIQDVGAEIHGMVATFLKYGNLKIHTASENKDFIFKHAANPHGMRNKISKAIATQKAPHTYVQTGL